MHRRTGREVPWTEGRDLWWHEVVDSQSGEYDTERTGAEDPYMIIYTSGTTGKPKGTVHVHAGFPIKATQDLAHCFDLQDDDILFWFTDLGWMMGPWAVAGALMLGSTLFIYDGAPDYPGPDRLWKMVERHGITTLGLSPTVIRGLMRHGRGQVDGIDLSSLRVLGSTGEPWNPEAWWWLFREVGGERCPIINYSGGTEISGGILGCTVIHPQKPCSFTGPIPGMDVEVVDEQGQPVRGQVGELVIRKPWVGMTRGFWRDPDRYIESYWSRWPGSWVHGDWAMTDEDGFWYILGRSDDTIKVAGKRLGPAEVEAAAVAHPAVTEAAAIGVPDEVKGEAVVCFAVLNPGVEPSESLREEIGATIARAVGEGPQTEGGQVRPRPAKDQERQDHAACGEGQLPGSGAGRHLITGEPRRYRGDRKSQVEPDFGECGGSLSCGGTWNMLSATVSEVRIIEEFLELVRIDSPTSEEAEIARVLGSKLLTMGFSVRNDGTGPSTGNLIAHLNGTAPDRAPLALSAHMDTVEPGRGVQPVLSDGVVRSSGDTILGADNKASLVAILEGARAVLEAGLPRPDLDILFTWGEERAHLGARVLDLSMVQAEMCILPDVEAPIGTIVTRAPAYRSLRARVQGRAAHAGANPEAGINALVAASRAIARMTLGRVDEETTANIGLFRAGAYRNAVPALAEMEGEVRSLDDARAAAQIETMGQIMREEAEKIGATVELQAQLEYRPFNLDPDSPVVLAARRALERLGVAVTLASSCSGSDANEFNNKGLPTAVLGTGMVATHSANEHIAVNDLVLLSRLMAELITSA